MAEHAHAHAHGSAHGTSHYVKIWAILLALLAVSVIGPMAEIPTLTLLTAFGVALVKAFLVMKYFMHLDAELKLVWYILAGSLALMVLYFFGVAADVMNHEGTRWVNVAANAEVERGLAAGDGHHDDGHAPEPHGEAAPHAPAPTGHEAPGGGH